MLVFRSTGQIWSFPKLWNLVNLNMFTTIKSINLIYLKHKIASPNIVEALIIRNSNLE
jgi:hypothetical protein